MCKAHKYDHAYTTVLGAKLVHVSFTYGFAVEWSCFAAAEFLPAEAFWGSCPAGTCMWWQDSVLDAIMRIGCMLDWDYESD